MNSFLLLNIVILGIFAYSLLLVQAGRRHSRHTHDHSESHESKHDHDHNAKGRMMNFGFSEYGKMKAGLANNFNAGGAGAEPEAPADEEPVSEEREHIIENELLDFNFSEYGIKKSRPLDGQSGVAGVALRPQGSTDQ